MCAFVPSIPHFLLLFSTDPPPQFLGSLLLCKGKIDWLLLLLLLRPLCRCAISSHLTMLLTAAPNLGICTKGSNFSFFKSQISKLAAAADSPLFWAQCQTAKTTTRTLNDDDDDWTNAAGNVGGKKRRRGVVDVCGKLAVCESTSSSLFLRFM